MGVCILKIIRLELKIEEGDTATTFSTKVFNRVKSGLKGGKKRFTIVMHWNSDTDRWCMMMMMMCLDTTKKRQLVALLPGHYDLSLPYDCYTVIPPTSTSSTLQS